MALGCLRSFPPLPRLTVPGPGASWLLPCLSALCQASPLEHPHLLSVLCAGQWEGVSLSRVSRRTRCRFVSVDVKADARRRLHVLKMDGHRQLAHWCSRSRGPDCPLMGTRAASIGFALSDTPV